MNEKAVASHILLAAAQRDLWLGRNNSGGFYDQSGRFVRYGLGAFTEADGMASSDYIGWTPTFITPDMVGQVLPVFTAVETKPSDWKFYRSDKRACNQQAFIDMVRAAGGKAGFATSVADFRKIIE